MFLWCDLAKSEAVACRRAHLVGAMGQYTHRPPLCSLMTVMRTTVATFVNAKDCSCSKVHITPGTTLRRACMGELQAKGLPGVHAPSSCMQEITPDRSVLQCGAY